MLGEGLRRSGNGSRQALGGLAGLAAGSGWAGGEEQLTVARLSISDRRSGPVLVLSLFVGPCRLSRQAR
ncbi:hypothetical protein A4R35_17360 [Thermogemmatispora tikiterensis]|uniref:Uncharacterized protein n=1 Tax=Thermogemmatispora tikiterensis TaxID=1825093 RepID=A0A328VK73_9CHLR|nr:hypothetical protein A4R35_17360 [Thermogemmatispora tikiterensis]